MDCSAPASQTVMSWSVWRRPGARASWTPPPGNHRLRSRRGWRDADGLLPEQFGHHCEQIFHSRATKSTFSVIRCSLHRSNLRHRFSLSDASSSSSMFVGEPERCTRYTAAVLGRIVAPLAIGSTCRARAGTCPACCSRPDVIGACGPVTRLPHRTSGHADKGRKQCSRSSF